MIAKMLDDLVALGTSTSVLGDVFRVFWVDFGLALANAMVGLCARAAEKHRALDIWAPYLCLRCMK